jgi:hypothetical protein
MLYTIAKAIERGYGIVKQETRSIEIADGETQYFYITPPKQIEKWIVAELVYGALEPAGTSADFVVKHRGVKVAEHEHGWVHSVVDYPEGLYDILNAGEKHEFWVTNRTGQEQRADMAFKIVEFRSEKAWDEYRAMVEEIRSILETEREQKRLMEIMIERIGEQKEVEKPRTVCRIYERR